MDKHARHSRALRASLCATASAIMLGISSGTNAAAVITAIELLDGAGTLDSVAIDNDGKTIDLDKTFSAIAPMTIRLTVGHGTGGGNTYTVTESITNDTGIEWSDYHFAFADTNLAGGILFGNFQSSTLFGFSLDAPPDSGPFELNYSGTLAIGASTEAGFALHLFDPGAGNNFTLDLVQTPTTPVPLPAAAWLLGSAVMGIAVTRRKYRTS